MTDMPVDFTNPEAIAAELEAVNAAPEAKKAKKPAKPKIVVCPNCQHEFELPKATSIRGIVAGIPVEEMTADQLKIEYRNANSVYYKTTKAGRDATKAGERLERVKAAMEAAGIQPTARTTTVDANTIANLIKSGKVSIDDIQTFLDQQ